MPFKMTESRLCVDGCSIFTVTLLHQVSRGTSKPGSGIGKRDRPIDQLISLFAGKEPVRSHSHDCPGSGLGLNATWPSS